MLRKWCGWKRVKKGKTIGVSSLGIGRARMVHLPGECFIEYQLAAKAARPDLFVAVAAYGDYAPRVYRHRRFLRGRRI